MSPRNYPAKVFWSQEDEGFIALAPDLPGCSAWGQTEAEALTELRSAIAAWIAAAQSAGNPVPLPTVETEPDVSGKLLLRLPKSLHASLIRSAATEGVSLNQHLVALLASTIVAKTSERYLSHFLPELVQSLAKRVAVSVNASPQVSRLELTQRGGLPHAMPVFTGQHLYVEDFVEVHPESIAVKRAASVRTATSNVRLPLELQTQ